MRRATAVVVLIAVDLSVVVLIRSSHRGTHIAESVVFPGAGLFENHRLLAIGFGLAVVAATVMWMTWGTDWLLGAVWVSALVATFAWAPASHQLSSASVRLSRESHEFPLVMAVMAALTWLKSLLLRVPGVRRLRRARRSADESSGRSGSVVDCCRAASLAALAVAAGSGDVDGAAHRRAIQEPRIRRRARRVGAVARWRFRGDPLRADQAHIRTALLLWGLLDSSASDAFRDEARRRVSGVPASEAGWVRPLDGCLAAAALSSTRSFEDLRSWRVFIGERWGLRRGHRPAWWYEPFGLAAGSSPRWEQAAMSVVSRAHGWTGDADWTALRPSVLGAAARRDDDPFDQRLVAAGRVWLAFVDDPQAGQVIARRTPGSDPVAVALTQLAVALHARPTALQRPSQKPVDPSADDLSVKSAAR